MLNRALTPLLALSAAALVLASAASAINIDWVTVGAPGNVCDVQVQGCFGAVASPYQIARYKVTNAHYAAFLNAVAATDGNSLYDVNMGDVGLAGGIARSGSSGSYTYSAIAGRENRPVTYVSFYDAVRFANWLHNGQPNTGVQTSGTTEAGSYTLSGPTSVGPRLPGATVFIPTENEWYKAAYFSPLSSSYLDYPAGSDVQTTCALPGATPNTANCDGVVAGCLSNVGSYPASPGPWGTSDQGGLAWEWNETIIFGSFRGQRGGYCVQDASLLAAASQSTALPVVGSWTYGFRVARLAPAPPAIPIGGVAGPVVAGLLVLTGLLGVAYQERRHSGALTRAGARSPSPSRGPQKQV